MDDKTSSLRTKRYAEKQKERGYIRCWVWVPADKVDLIKAFASRLRRRFISKNPQ
jgi:hypothetical protein